MFKCSGDARNHVSAKWRVTKYVDVDDFYIFKMSELQKKYFILEVHHKKRRYDMIKDMRVDENEYRRYKRTNTIDSILND